MQPLLNLHTWVSLPNDVRFKIRNLFNIPRSGNVFVNDGVVETDGTTSEDIKHLTIEKMQEYLSSEETDFNKLFDLVVSNIINPKVIEPEVKKEEPVINANPTKNVKKVSKKQ